MEREPSASEAAPAAAALFAWVSSKTNIFKRFYFSSPGRTS
ncbi:SERGEF isoform 4 [Pan troglodytes]|uniref:Secretion regulating guanine nucleotide exchange factor n=3 Tax=Hominidae TaxID=9604 RepID=E9PIU4_HUMAN|nr:SERGEF isoform 4 [Pan troglodytes]PNJ47521.1 SERGEF isoform 22 [Pongo abelii]